MANIEISNVSGVFPAGTVVNAYKLRGFGPTRDPDAGPPAGSSAGSAAVAASGALTITGLEEGAYYLLYAQVAGKDTYLHAHVDLQGETTLITNSDFAVVTAGKGLRVKEGANAKQGVATLAAGTVTVPNTSVTATSRIFLTRQPGGANPGSPYVSAITAGTSFVITSTSGTDTGTIAYQIFEPA